MSERTAAGDEVAAHRLFDALTAGRLDVFLGGCVDDLVLTVIGSGPLTTLVRKGEIAAWYRSMGVLAGASFRSDVCFVLDDERATLVLLRHTLTREGTGYSYETANRCTFRDGLLASWFSRPVRRDDYARAWGIDRLSVGEAY
jgi:ketosteroid isomerase-like protein